MCNKNKAWNNLDLWIFGFFLNFAYDYIYIYIYDGSEFICPKVNFDNFI